MSAGKEYVVVPKQQFTVFHSCNGEATMSWMYVATLFAPDIHSAKTLWDEMYGDNYGKVLIVPFDAFAGDDHITLVKA